MNKAPLLDFQNAAPSYPDGVPPEVCLRFESLALDLITAGFTHYSADAILHKIRWDCQVERGDRGFKINNNHAAPLARWFARRNPKRSEFFQTRTSTAKAAPIEVYADY